MTDAEWKTAKRGHSKAQGNEYQSALKPKGEQTGMQMKTAWDRYLEQQLADPVVQLAYENESKVLSDNSKVRLSPPART